MVGRGAYGRPWFLAQVAHFLRTGTHLPDPPLAEQRRILRDHFRAMLAHHGEQPGVRLARKHVAWYAKGLPGSAEFRAAINRAETASEVEALIDGYYLPLIEAGGQRLAA
jgi:tRNA-dihydrouridine synthase B